MARERAIQIRVSQDEYDRIAELAGEMGISEYMRTAALEGRISEFLKAKQSPEAAKALRREKEAEEVAEGQTPVPPTKQLARLIKQLEAQGNPDAEEVARKRLGM